MARQKKREPEKSSKLSSGGFDPSALDALIGEARTGEDIELLFRQMKKALMERILNGELRNYSHIISATSGVRKGLRVRSISVTAVRPRRCSLMMGRSP